MHILLPKCLLLHIFKCLLRVFLRPLDLYANILYTLAKLLKTRLTPVLEGIFRKWVRILLIQEHFCIIECLFGYLSHMHVRRAQYFVELISVYKNIVFVFKVLWILPDLLVHLFERLKDSIFLVIPEIYEVLTSHLLNRFLVLVHKLSLVEAPNGIHQICDVVLNIFLGSIYFWACRESIMDTLHHLSDLLEYGLLLSWIWKCDDLLSFWHHQL